MLNWHVVDELLCTSLMNALEFLRVEYGCVRGIRYQITLHHDPSKFVCERCQFDISSIQVTHCCRRNLRLSRKTYFSENYLLASVWNILLTTFEYKSSRTRYTSSFFSLFRYSRRPLSKLGQCFDARDFGLQLQTRNEFEMKQFSFILLPLVNSSNLLLYTIDANQRMHSLLTPSLILHVLDEFKFPRLISTLLTFIDLAEVDIST